MQRRMKAARELAGISVDQLAQRINEKGLKTRTLRKIEQGERDLNPREVPAVAAACNVPPEFFEVDFWRLGELSAQPTERARQAAEAAAERARQQRERSRRDRADPPQAAPGS